MLGDGDLQCKNVRGEEVLIEQAQGSPSSCFEAAEVAGVVVFCRRPEEEETLIRHRSGEELQRVAPVDVEDDGEADGCGPSRWGTWWPR